MIVQCISFGSAWWLRPAYDAQTHALIRTQSAFMNTTCIIRGRRVRWAHKIPGFVRINAGIRPHFTSGEELLQGKFETLGVERYKETNRILLEARAPAAAEVDKYLVRVRSTDEGTIDFKTDWRTGAVRIVSSSFHDNEQEALLLMDDESIIQTAFGAWRIMCKNKTSFLGLIDPQ